jgi:hypothetical protein
MFSTILVGLLAAAISGFSGYYLSYKFNSSNYAATDTSGDFGAPRGGFFALLSGAMIGLILFSLLSHTTILPAGSAGIGMIVSLIVGAIAGVTGMIRGTNSRRKGEDKK